MTGLVEGGGFIRLMAALTSDMAALGGWVSTMTFAQREVKCKV